MHVQPLDLYSTKNGKLFGSHIVINGFGKLEDGKGARVALLHTEEESEDKLQAMAVWEGQSFEHLMDNVDVKNVGSSRIAVVYYCYDAQMRAEDEAAKFGGHVTDYLVRGIFLDYGDVRYPEL